MTRVLAVSDEVDEALARDVGPVRGVELVLACGDLPFDYLRHLADGLDVPLVFVPGNHDPDLSGYRGARNGLTLQAGIPSEAPWPGGTINADGAVVDAAGLRIAGLGGCRRYSHGRRQDRPNQYSDRQQALRSVHVRSKARWRRFRDGRGVDILLTHAPPYGVGDADDIPHRGFTALHPLVHALRPNLLLHGHIHPYGAATPDLHLGDTVVRNVVGVHLFEVEPSARGVYTGRRAP